MSEDIDRRKARHPRQAVPKVDCKAHVTGPERISAAPVFLTRFPALSHRRHRECAGSFEPHCVIGPTIELEERVTIAAGTVAKIGTLGERTSCPTELAPFNQEDLELRRREWCVCKRRDHAGSSVTILAQPRRLVVT